MRIALPPAIDPAAFADRPAGPVVDIGGETMGTRWSLRFAMQGAIDGAGLRAAIGARLDAIVAEMSHWAPSSRLCAFNAAPADSWTVLPRDFADVMTAALDIAARTGGAFDPAIGHIVDLHGFGPACIDRPPSPEALGTAHAASGWRRLTLADGRLHQPGGVALDLSGIAKGFAVDAVAALAREQGVRHGLVEIGGELAGWGIRPDGDPWWVDLETPPCLSLAPVRVALHGLSVATSGDYVRGRHTIDPRTARPSDSGVVAVSVLHASAMLADAWATALTVLGPGDGLALAARHGIAARIVTTDEHLSPAFAAMLRD